MAIQFRRGQYSQFDKSRLVAGEPAVVLSGDPNVTDGKAFYICFAAGDVKRLATAEDFAEYLAGELSDMQDDLEDRAGAISASMDAGLEAGLADISEACEAISEAGAQEARDAAAEARSLSDRFDFTEARLLDITVSQADVDALKACCEAVRADIGNITHALALSALRWLYACETAFAPTTAAASVSSTKATVAGTVSGTVINFSD